MNRLRTAVCCGLLFLIAAVAGRALAFPQILIGFSSTGCTAPSTVQSSGLVPFAPSTGNFAQITLTSVVAGHDIIVQAFAFGGPVSSAPSISVTESSGSVVYSQDTYAQITPASSEYYQVGIYRLHNAAAGTHVITIANSAGTFNSYGDASAIEAANVSATAPVINSNSNISGSSNPTTGSATPAANCSISISTVSMASLSSSETFGHPPSGYTSIAVNTNGTQGPNNSQVGSADYLIQSSTATPQNPSYATFTAAKPWVAALAIYSGVGGGSGPLNAIKWHPGFYMGSSVLTNAPNVGGNNSYRQSTEIPALRSGPSQVLGETCYYFWTNFENTTAGVYSFSAIDSDYVALTGYVSGSTTSAVYSAPRRMNIYFVQTDYFSANPTTRGTVPSYMLASSSYGPGPGGGSGYGYWTTTGASGLGGGSTIAYWRPAVIARLQALMTAMANHVLPDGYTVDTSPYIEWVKPYLETSDPPANSNTVYGSAADPTFSTNGFMTQLQAINTTMASVFPHTNYAAPANFTAGDPTGNGTEDVTLVQSLPAVRGGVGGPGCVRILRRSESRMLRRKLRLEFWHGRVHRIGAPC
jgi:hypothetical protein